MTIDDLFIKVANNQIKNEGLNYISKGIPKVKGLKNLTLDLQNNMISDDSVPYLARMVKDSHLDKLNINITKNHITDKGMILLCQLIKECRHLKVLDLKSDMLHIEEKKEKYIQHYL